CVFVLAASRLNNLCLLLSPIALLWVLGYSYSKRFTRYSHMWLGLGLSIAPVGGFLAVTGAWSEPWWLLCALAMGVVTWSSGFDILYALQDTEFDARNGLHSIPSAIGVPRAIYFARALHVIAVVCLGLIAVSVPRIGVALSQNIVWFGVALAAGLLIWEHRLVKADDLSRLDAAFFTMNGIISLSFFACVLAARLVGARW
ncbi:MAG: UbiA family prenyltransferase, partial [Gemmatimonadota bacterium]|nr:UbiA family prenyltransferase [Gemmatimonadota bacterium]